MLDKFTPRPLANLADRARIGVTRHRMASRLAGRGQNLLAVATALVLIGAGTLAADAAVPDPDPAAGAAAGIGEQPALADREAATSRADRSTRDEPGESGEPTQPGEPTEPGSSRATPPEESPEPKPEPAPEPKPAEAEQPEPARPAAPADWVHPMPGAATTSCFGWRWGVLHAGVDLAAPAGTPIRAVGAGRVTDAGWVFGGYGISVVIDHGGGFYTHYAHASQANVSPGQHVSPGQTIALEGSTGDSTGPHLHLEVHQGMWNQIEPTAWLRDRGVAVGGC